MEIIDLQWKLHYMEITLKYFIYTKPLSDTHSR